MDYEGYLKQRLDALRAEGRYRVFADLERRCGRFPRVFDHRIGAEVTAWCQECAARPKRRFAEAGLPETPSPSHVVR